MPIVSINLSGKAYQIYEYLAKSRRASRIVSACLVNWDRDSQPILLEGDRRTMTNGDLCEWTQNGWMVIDDGVVPVVETENERWIREQKEAFGNE